MSQFRYRPTGASGWLAVASPGRLLVVHPGAIEVALSVFDSGRDHSGQGFQVALDELTRGGLSATPPFALLEWLGSSGERALRVIVRGGVKAVVTAAGSEHTLDGSGVSTWTEQSFQQVTAFEVVVVPEPDSTFGADRWLPLDSGVASVAHVSSKSGFDSSIRPTDDGYDYHFGETMYRNVPEAGVRDDELERAEVPDAEPIAGDHDDMTVIIDDHDRVAVVTGDHDGLTIMTDDLKRLRDGRRARENEAPPAPPAPVLYLELSNGSRETLSQPILVGRAPTASKVSGAALPRLVSIPGDKDISRNHAQFAVEGGTVVVTDLHSRNGTQVIMPGRAPQQLRQGEPTAVITGTVVDLGGGVTLTVCEEA